MIVIFFLQRALTLEKFEAETLVEKALKLSSFVVAAACQFLVLLRPLCQSHAVILTHILTCASSRHIAPSGRSTLRSFVSGKSCCDFVGTGEGVVTWRRQVQRFAATRLAGLLLILMNWSFSGDIQGRYWVVRARIAAMRDSADQGVFKATHWNGHECIRSMTVAVAIFAQVCQSLS